MTDPTKQRMVEMLKSAFPLVQDADVVRRNAEDSGGMYWTWDAVEKILAWSDQREAASVAAALARIIKSLESCRVCENGPDAAAHIRTMDIFYSISTALAIIHAQERAPLEAQLAALTEIYHAEVRKSEMLDQQIGEAKAAGFAEGRGVALEDVQRAITSAIRRRYSSSATGEVVSGIVCDVIRALKATKP